MSIDHFAVQYQPQREFQLIAQHGPRFAHDLSKVDDGTSFADYLYTHELAMPRVYSTSAPVTRIRRVRAYIGDARKARSPRYVSGLLFEYYGGYPPTVLGQLMDPGAEFHIAYGERVVSFSVWTTCRKGCQEPGPSFGKVVGIQIRTSWGRSTLFRPNIYSGSEDKDLFKCVQHRFSSNCIGNLVRSPPFITDYSLTCIDTYIVGLQHLLRPSSRVLFVQVPSLPSPIDAWKDLRI